MLIPILFYPLYGYCLHSTALSIGFVIRIMGEFECVCTFDGLSTGPSRPACCRFKGIGLGFGQLIAGVIIRKLVTFRILF